MNRRAAAVFAVAALCAAPSALAATGGSLAGVFADGAIDYAFLPCFSLSCDGAFGNDFLASSGDVGSTGPAIIDGFAAHGTGSASVDARSLITSSFALPTLGAKSVATPGVGMHDGFCCEGAYFFASTASAQARQYYTYTGDTEQHYTLRYTLHGYLASTLPAPTETDEALIQGSGGLALYDDQDNNIEQPFGHLIDIHQVSRNSSAHDFFEFGTVSITLTNPGDSFYLLAFVAANVGLLGYGVADLSNTLSVEFVAGDTSQLVAALIPVPEPPAVALLALGLAGLAALRARRSA